MESITMPAINALAEEVHKGNVERGFWDKPEQNVGELLMLCTSELGEALEAHRKGKYADLATFEARLKEVVASKAGHELTNDEYAIIFKHSIKDTFEDEIADTFIRLLDMAAGLNIDLEKHVAAKLAYNSTRPHKHGKAY